MDGSLNTNKKAFKSGIWYTASNFLIKGIGFLTTPIFTRLLTKAEFGAFNNFTSWLSILTIFVTLNLQATLISARYDYEDKFDEYIFSMLGLSSITAVIAFFIANLFPAQITNYLQIDIKYLNAMLVYLLFLPAISLFQSRQIYSFKYRTSVLISLIIAVSTAVLSVVLVLTLNNKLSGRIFGSVIPTIVVGIIIYIFFIRKGKRIRISYWKYALPICLPYIPHLLSMSFLNSMDRVMITRICGDEQTALYSLAYNCGNIVSLLLTAINTAFSPWLAERLKNEEYEVVRRFSKKYISGFLAFLVLIMLLTPEVLLILGGHTYMEAIYVLAPVSIGCFCQFLYTMYVNVEQFYKRTIGMAIASVTAAGINYILNSIFIPRVGYLAAAYTTLVGFICLLLIHLYLVWKIGKSNVYENKYVLLMVLFGLVLMVGITFLYTNTLLRYCILGVYLCLVTIFIIQNKNTAKKLVRMIIK